MAAMGLVNNRAEGRRSYRGHFGLLWGFLIF